MSNDADFEPDLWGPLATRYEKKQPRKLLSLDGGGIRGLISLKVLMRIEELVRQRTGAERLCDYFDYIGGTSTGAIIAAGLAIGMTVTEILAFYRDFAKRVFTKSKPWERLLYAKFTPVLLEKKLLEAFGQRDLRPENLHCLLLIVTRNASTDSVWPLSSNPQAKYNREVASPENNLRMLVSELLRASTAAPLFFPPRVVHVGKHPYAFVDGATTAYNNPAFLLYRMATSKPFNLSWPAGVDNLMLVSVGTGLSPAPRQDAKKPKWNKLRNARATVKALLNQASIDQDTICRTMGDCVYGHQLDSEVGDLLNHGNAFRYVRYNVELTKRGLSDLNDEIEEDPDLPDSVAHQVELDERRISKIQELDSIGELETFEAVGDALATRVKLHHFDRFLS